MKIDSVIILTHKQDGRVLLPHLYWLDESNPFVDIHVVVGEDSPHGKFFNWKNGDIPLRKWWRENHEIVKGDGIAVIEWDTLVSCSFPEIPDNYDLVGGEMYVENLKNRGKWRIRRRKNIKWTPDNWYWWPETSLLNLEEDQHAIGLVSFGCFLMKRKILDHFIDDKWDHLYEKSIQNELRFPTIAHLGGFKVGEINLPHVDYTTVDVSNERGIYHSVKRPYNGIFI